MQVIFLAILVAAEMSVKFETYHYVQGVIMDIMFSFIHGGFCLVIGEIGEKNKMSVTQDELRRALIERARQFPGQEKMVYEYFEKTPGALAELRAPIFEEKVIDYVLEQVKPVEKKVSKDELFKMVEEVTEA